MPRLSKQEAIKNALDFTGAKVYKWEIPAEEALLKEITHDKNATYYPQPSLIYFSGDGEMNIAAMRLAYVLEVFANSPLSKKEIFVDAISGKILGVRQKLYDVDVNANAQTAYSGLQQITTDQVNTNLYRLRSANRGNGIVVLNMSGQGMNYGGATDFTNSSTTWSTFNPAIDRYATDAMWGQQKTYDFYKTTFNRNRVDNAGLALYGYVHTNLVAFGFSNNTNAFWDGSKMTYRDGSSTVTPLTALDIVGHEITHGLTQYTAKLIYNGESGALNESFSDMLGTASEFFGKPNTADWLIGENIGTPFRSMSNPKQYGQPNTYHGQYYYTGNSDNGGVHTNSGVSNYWFYLVASGGGGVNDLNNAYSVQGVGISQAQTIAYNTLVYYINNTSCGFALCRNLSIQAAKDSYGYSSSAVKAVQNAWYAVGVGNAYPVVTGTSAFCTSNVYSVSNLNAGASVTWTVSPSGIVNLTPNGSQVTATKVSQGNATITATISRGGDDNGEAAAISITTTTSSSITYNINGPCSNGYQTWALSATANMPGAYNWHWTVDPGFSGSANIMQPNQSSTYVDVQVGGGISVTYSDLCGETSPRNGVTVYSNCGHYSAVNIYPNPTTGLVNVDFNVKDSVSTVNPTKPQAVLLPETVDLFSEKSSSALFLQTKKVIIQNQNKAIFNVSGLAPGLYFIHINYRNNTVEKTIQVN